MQAYPRLAELAHETYEPRGIFNSEMAAVIALSVATGVDVFVESGRARGHSTLLLAKHLGPVGIAIHSFDRDRNADAVYSEAKLTGLPRLHLHYGDSRLLIPQFVAGLAGKRIGLLVDGPKDRKAFALLSDCLIRSDDIAVAFVHDLPRYKNSPSEGRVYAQKYFEDPFFTDDAEFVERFGYLDAPVFAATDADKGHWKPYRNGELEMASYGPTLGVFIPAGADRKAATQRGVSVSAPQRLYWSLKDRLRRRATRVAG